jgi:hypothetical protein
MLHEKTVILPENIMERMAQEEWCGHGCVICKSLKAHYRAGFASVDRKLNKPYILKLVTVHS